MRIAVLSGKGGTGKTFVSVNLAITIGNSVYCDCDVEEPNGKIFLKCDKTEEKTVSVKIPSFNQNLCTGCRHCVDFCKFGALFFVKNKPKLISNLCHSCKGCSIVCDSSAIKEVERPIGKTEKGNFLGVDVAFGSLNLGEVSGVPVIKAVKNIFKESKKDIVIDCPPGSSCSVMESISDSDFCIIVTEPTPFGFHNFKMVYELTRVLGKPCGVVINKYEFDYAPLICFCKENYVPILEKIPFDKKLGEKISKGEIPVLENPSIKQTFISLKGKLERIQNQ